MYTQAQGIENENVGILILDRLLVVGDASEHLLDVFVRNSRGAAGHTARRRPHLGQLCVVSERRD